MSFHVGQKMVCVDASPSRNGGRATLVRGQVYVIRFISTDYDDGGIGLHLHGVPDDVARPLGRGPAGWAPGRFRPVVERKTDTGFAILEEILRRETVPAQPKQPALSSTV